jgi:N-methylhydantoinase B/oxoprolinase/acetone carboxylase alpha subunit
MQEHTPTVAIDPITLEVIRHGLVSITNQIDANIKRTAFSPYIYEYNDFAVGLVGAEGQLIAQCTGGMPPFVADSVGAATACTTATSCSAITPPCRASTSTTRSCTRRSMPGAIAAL